MKIYRADTDKKRYLPLLLLADEQENMIDRYLSRGTMFVLEAEGVVCGECVVTDEGGGILELKNIAVAPNLQGMGYGKALVDFVCAQYRGQYAWLHVGTGDSPLTLPFYEKLGFTRFSVVKDFFTLNYDHPMIEDGVLLRDMIYLRKRL